MIGIDGGAAVAMPILPPEAGADRPRRMVRESVLSRPITTAGLYLDPLCADADA
jgi:hypothetical protein